MTLKRLGIIALVIIVILAVANNPQQYAAVGKKAGNEAMEIADGIGEFLGALAS